MSRELLRSFVCRSCFAGSEVRWRSSPSDKDKLGLSGQLQEMMRLICTRREALSSQFMVTRGWYRFNECGKQCMM